MKILAACLLACIPALAQSNSIDVLNRNRPVLDAHNCYPYEGKWSDRLDRALATGYPVGIEQDVAWALSPGSDIGRPVVSHTPKTTGAEPALRDYFFEHVRPRVEEALKRNDRAAWPLIVLHFDFKDNRPELLHAVWDLLGEYEAWITTAPKGADPLKLNALDVRPLLVLTEENDAQEHVFFTSLPAGSRLRIFGSAHSVELAAPSRSERAHLAATAAPQFLLTSKPTNYRRWWNNSWAVVEEGGQANAGDWTAQDAARLKALVDYAHGLGFWVRFYTLDGFREGEDRGWGQGYNFGSHESALIRWKAAWEAGVNLIATDQYEELAATLKTFKHQ